MKLNQNKKYDLLIKSNTIENILYKKRTNDTTNCRTRSNQIPIKQKILYVVVKR
jgi:hypothetical protein